MDMVAGQQWRALDLPALGAWQPELSVCVVLPARDCQEELDRTLAALAQQTYPAHLLRVVVADDASTPPLKPSDLRPQRTEILRLDDAQSHGSGRARHAGAMHTDADIVLFLDADMVAEGTHVEAHARWHHLTPHAVVLGRKSFVDFSGISARDVHTATGSAGMDDLLAGRRRRRHEWQEDLIEEQDDLTQDRDDAFLAVVGATVSIRRDHYTRTGGFSAFGLRGIVDTEFGYRAFTSGGLIIPDEQALCYHQGRRSFASRGDEIKRARTGLAANYLPIPLFRRSESGRQWAVPMVSLVVDAREAEPEQAQVTVDSVLASDFTDLAVTVVGTDLPSWLIDYFGHDARVRLEATPPVSGFPSPFSGAVSAGLMLEPASLRQAVHMLGDLAVGVLRTHPGDCAGQGLELWRTRALLRALDGGVGDLDERVAELSGERWVAASGLGVSRATVTLTKQGMIVGEAEGRTTW